MDCRNCDDSTCTPPSDGSYSNNGSPFRSHSMRSRGNDVDTAASLIFPLSLIISER